MEAEKELELVRRMKKGERAAFDKLYEQYYDRLYRTACMITGNRADGEDVTQETFIKAYLNCDKLKKEEQFRYWLYQILNRTAWQIAKKHAKERPEERILELADTSTADSPAVKVLQDEQERAIAEAVRRLEYRQRTTVILYYFNGLGTKEIARVMECMEGTVKSRLFTARKNLRTLLSEELSDCSCDHSEQLQNGRRRYAE
ncbi:MAG: RNA polymerase sigma factor [Lachnospiraceae bacterium]